MKTMKVITKSPFPTNQSINSTQPDELGQLTLIGMREGTFHPLVLFGLDFVSWIFIKNFQTFLEVKIDINILPVIELYEKMPLGGAKAEHFSCFHSSCQ